MPPRDLDGPDDILARSDDDDAERLDLVNAGIGRLQRPGYAVEPDLAVDPILELPSQEVGHSNRSASMGSNVAGQANALGSACDRGGFIGHP